MRIKKEYTALRALLANRRMSAATFWTEVATRAVSFLCAAIILALILSVTLPGTVAQINRICIYATVGLGILWAIPFIRFTRMRLRDAGISPKAYWWLVLPGIGWVVFGVLMCAKSTPSTAGSSAEIL